MHRKILKVLNDPSVVFKTTIEPEPRYGWYQSSVVAINLIELIIPIVIHECLHHINPTMDEDNVHEMHETILNSMSFEQKKRMFALFMRRVDEYEKEENHKSEEGNPYQKP